MPAGSFRRALRTDWRRLISPTFRSTDSQMLKRQLGPYTILSPLERIRPR